MTERGEICGGDIVLPPGCFIGVAENLEPGDLVLWTEADRIEWVPFREGMFPRLDIGVICRRDAATETEGR